MVSCMATTSDDGWVCVTMCAASRSHRACQKRSRAQLHRFQQQTKGKRCVSHFSTSARTQNTIRPLPSLCCSPCRCHVRPRPCPSSPHSLLLPNGWQHMRPQCSFCHAKLPNPSQATVATVPAKQRRVSHVLTHSYERSKHGC